jgi:hypothetical protein
VTQTDVARFVEILSYVRVDDDYLHNMMMDIRPEAVQMMLGINPHLTRQLVLRFVAFTSATS